MRTPPRGRHLVIIFAGLLMLSLGSVSAAAQAAMPRGQQSAAETIAVNGLGRPVEILIDRWGVPHIYARDEADLFFAQGFNAARDRLFQIDLWRRRGLGELAEVFGPPFVDQDTATRLFLYRGDMEKEWAVYGSDARQIAERFVAGVNAYIDWLSQHSERLPWEFKKLNYYPAKWRAEDVVRIRSHGLTRNLNSEVARARVMCAADLKSDEIRIGLLPDWITQAPPGLDPCLPKDILKVFTLATQEVRLTHDASSAAAVAQSASAVELASDDQPAEDLEGSNNWVIAAWKSATGRAIMANDPHRAYSEPSLRYICDLNAPTLHVVGAGEPALPGISLGHNDWIAFGYTIFNVDQEDLYFYELNPANPNQYKYQAGWEPFRVVREEIKVKNQPSAFVDLRFTRHGPVIYLEKEKSRAFAVRTAWLEPGMSPYYGSLRYMRARDFDQFTQAIEYWGAPTLNHVYADVNGNIGWAPGGLAPIRPNWDGLLPVPGDGRFEWAGHWKGAQLPRVYNPASGYLTTSNEMNLPADYPYKDRKLGFEWTNPSRHQRIDEVMSAASKLGMEDSMRLQNDQVSIPARRLVTLLKPLSSDDPKTTEALTILQGWNATMDADAPAAALHEVWFSRHLGKAFKNALLSKTAAEAIAAPDPAVMLDALERPEKRFGGSPVEKRNQLLLVSLRSAYEEMEKLQGPDAKQWRWGKLHYNLCEHPFSGIVDGAIRAKINVGPIEKNGSPFAPSQSAYRTSDFRQTGGPSVRVVVDVGNWDDSRAVNHPGQSGDPDSPHYRDLAQLWRNGQYFRLLYSRKAVDNETEKTINLVPTSSAQHIVLGVLEDVPGSYAGEPNSRMVRVVFEKNGTEWKAFPSQCPDEACLKTASSKYPGEVTWTIAFDGRDLGHVTARTPKEFDSYSHIGLQQVISPGPIPTVGKRSPEYGGFADAALYRPLVAVSEPNFKDPEVWKPSQLSAEVLRLLRQQFRKKFPSVSNCRNRADSTPKPWPYTDENIKVLKTYSSNTHWSVAQIRLGENRCDGPPDDPFLDYWFAISPANEIILLDSGMWLVDAGDYDNDGKSELVFSIGRYNSGGYELFYDNFKKHVTFEFGYH
jgi:penicillin amidase